MKKFVDIILCKIITLIIENAQINKIGGVVWHFLTMD